MGEQMRAPNWKHPGSQPFADQHKEGTLVLLALEDRGQAGMVGRQWFSLGGRHGGQPRADQAQRRRAAAGWSPH